MAIEDGKARATKRSIRLEVCVLWGGSVVHLHSFRRPRSVSLGEAPDCDLRVPAARIAAKRVQIVDFDSAGRAFVHVPPSAYGHVVGPDGNELSTAYRGGPSSRTRCAEQRIPLAIGNSVTISFGDLVVLITAFEENAALRRTASSMRVWRGHALSFALHAAALLAMIAWGWGDEKLPHAKAAEPVRLVRITEGPSPEELHSFQPWHQWTPGSEHGLPPAPVEAGPLPMVPRGEPDWGESVPFGRTVTVVGTDATTQATPSPGFAPEVSARDNPSRFVVLPKGTTIKRIRAGVSNDQTRPRVEDLLYAFAQTPVAAIGALPLLTRVDAIPSPYDTEHHFARVVLQAPSKAGSARSRVLVVEASTLSQDRARRAVRALTQWLPTGSAITMVSYGDRAQVELGETRNRSAGLLRSVMNRAGKRAHDGDSIALAEALKLAVDAGCLHANTPTDIVLLFENAVLLSSPSIASISRQLLSPACSNTKVHAVQLLHGEPSERLLDSLPPSKVGKQAHVGPESDTFELDRLGDPLAPPAVVDVIVEVQFDSDKVLTHRLIGYEDSVNPEPLGSLASGRGRTSCMRAGEQITALYDLRLAAGHEPGLEVRVTYRVPNAPELRHITHRLTKDKTYETAAAAPRDLRHAVAVVGFAEYLRKSPYLAPSSLDKVLRLASRSNAREVEFVRLVHGTPRPRWALPARRVLSLKAEEAWRSP